MGGCRPHGQRVVPHNPGPQERAAGERRGRVDRQHAHPLVVTAQLGDNALVEVDLPTPEAGDADDLGVAGVRRQNRHHLRNSGTRPRRADQPATVRLAGAGALDEVRDRGISPSGHARSGRRPGPPPPQSGRARRHPPRRWARARGAGRSARRTSRPGGPARSRAAVDVHLWRRQGPARARRRSRRRQGLVELERGRGPSGRCPPSRIALAVAWRRAAAAGVESGPATCVRADLGEPRQPSSLGLRLAHHDHRGSPVGDLRGRARGDGAVLGGEGRAQAGRATPPSCRRGRPSSVVNWIRVALCAAGISTGTAEDVFGRHRGLLVRLRGELVLSPRGSGSAPPRCTPSVSRPHRLPGWPGRERRRTPSSPRASRPRTLMPSRDFGRKWGVRHRLHAAGDHDVAAGADQLVGQGDALMPGEATFVDRDRRDVHGDPTGDRGRAGRFWRRRPGMTWPMTT